MTYRADLEALTARQASLQAELGRKQRELAEVTGMLDEARRLRGAEAYFERAPALRQRQLRHLIAGALVAVLGSGAALGAAAAAAGADCRRATAESQRLRIVRIRDRAEQAEARALRLRAELAALRLQAQELGPAREADPAVAAVSPARRLPLWKLSATLPPGAPWDRVTRE